MPHFIGEIPADMVINHIDEDKCNNAVSNLEMTTRADNIRYGNRAEKAAESRRNGTSIIKRYNEQRKFTRSAENREKHREISKIFWKKLEEETSQN